jgi:predicted PurR-regulated permease PerM
MADSLYSRRRVAETALLLALAFSFYLCWRLIEPFLTSIIWAIALAVVGHPVQRFLERHLKPGLAAFIALTLITLLLVAPGVLLVQNISDEARGSIAWLRQNLSADGLHRAAERYTWAARLVTWFEARGDLDDQLSALAASLAARAPAALSGSAQVITQFAIMLVILFYFLRDRVQMLRMLTQFIPLSHAESTEFYQRVSETIRATLYGNLSVKLIQGFLGGAMFWMLGLPAPFLFGVAMAFAALVPLVGTAAVWAPAAIYLAVHGAWVKALILTGWGALVVGLADNLLYPILVAGELKVHTLGVFLSLLGGLVVFGLSGIVLGPVILAATMALVNIWRLRTASEQETAPENP